MLEIESLSAGHGGGTVLHGIDLTLTEGSVHAVLGHNGAGKTTLLHTVAGLLRPSRGSVTLAGRRLDGQPPHRIARAGVGLVPQGRRVFARLTVAEHLALAHRRPRGQAAPWTPQAVLRLLPRLDERRSQPGGRLSGGEQQMLALARALLGQPRLLLLDEPTEGLAPDLADEVLQLTRRLADDGLTVLLAAPQLRLAASVADRLTVLTAGRITAAQDGAAARADPAALLAALSPVPVTGLEATPLMPDSTYAFDNRAADAEVQLAVLEAFLDPITARRLDALKLAPGARCWEVGAGGGSIARLLAQRVGPQGRVIATDIDPARFRGEAANLELRRHDVRHEEPPGGGFDLIHARLVLLHLPERHEVLAALVGALRPGGVLLVEEFDRSPLTVLCELAPEQRALFARVVEGILDVLGALGADLHWAHRAPAAMTALGLREVHTTVHAESWTGDGGARLHEINSRQLQDRLLAAGLTLDELTRFRELVRRPGFSALSYSLVSTSARMPARENGVATVA